MTESDREFIERVKAHTIAPAGWHTFMSDVSRVVSGWEAAEKECERLSSALRDAIELIDQACKIKSDNDRLEDENDRFKEALSKIDRVSAMDYEYRGWARAALKGTP